MNTTVLMIVPVLFLAGALLAVLLLRKRSPRQDALGLMQQQLEGLRQELRESLSNVSQQVGSRLQEQSKVLASSGRDLNERLDKAAQSYVTLHNELGQLKEGSKRIFEIGKDISLLQESMRAPKFRGGFGEFFLADLLAQILPPDHFELQHGFRSGERVDAVVHTQEGMISIDSKFPLENFRRLVESSDEEAKKGARKEFLSDVKKHIDSIADKYICPDEGTLNFALMYIPAENVYYEIILKDESGGLLSHAQSKRVFPVSPNSFFAYLQTIAIGLRGMKVEAWARELDSQIERLKGDLERFAGDFSQIGTHIKNARGKYDAAEKRLSLFGDKLEQMVASRAEVPAALPEKEPVHLKSVKVDS